MTFDDLLAANEAHAASFVPAPLGAARQLAVVTCMDPRIDPLAAFGLRAGDAVVLRNPGARVNDDVLAALELAREALGVERVVVVGHTGCLGVPEDELDAVIAGDAARLDGVAAGGFVYDVETGRLRRVC